MDKKEYAIELKHDRHNCAQAVLCAYAEDLGMSAETLKRIGAAFGGGMGCMEGDCGALCGAEAVLGLMKADQGPVAKDAAALYRSFIAMSGSAICKELKGTDSGTVLCSCDDCVRNAVAALEDLRKKP